MRTGKGQGSVQSTINDRCYVGKSCSDNNNHLRREFVMEEIDDPQSTESDGSSLVVLDSSKSTSSIVFKDRGNNRHTAIRGFRGLNRGISTTAHRIERIQITNTCKDSLITNGLRKTIRLDKNNA